MTYRAATVRERVQAAPVIRPGCRSGQCRQFLLFWSPGHPHAVELCPAGSSALQLIERRAPEPRILHGDSGSRAFLGRIHSTPCRDLLRREYRLDEAGKVKNFLEKSKKSAP